MESLLTDFRRVRVKPWCSKAATGPVCRNDPDACADVGLLGVALDRACALAGDLGERPVRRGVYDAALARPLPV